jgi:transposase
VSQLDKIKDIETLRQAATILEKENERLHKRLQALTEELAKLKGTDAQQQLAIELTKLQEELANLQHRLFGRSSEKRSRKNQGSGEEKKEKQKGHGPRQQPELPNIERIIHLECGETCPFCHGLVELWEGQFEESQQITVVTRTFVMETIKRQKGKCTCGATVVTAPAPQKLVEGGRYSLEFAVEVALAKYDDHLPLERQVRMMLRDGLIVDSQTLWDQIWALYQLLHPIHREVLLHIVKQPVINVDETRWFMLKGPSKTWQLWAVAVSDAVYYEIQSSRSAEAAKRLFEQYHGILVVDGYKAYKSLALNNQGKFILAFCWSHARRKFIECSSAYPEETDEILDMIGKLYEVECQVPNVYDIKDETARNEALEKLAKLRNEISRGIVSDIEKWMKAQRATPESPPTNPSASLKTRESC